MDSALAMENMDLKSRRISSLLFDSSTCHHDNAKEFKKSRHSCQSCSLHQRMKRRKIFRQGDKAESSPFIGVHRLSDLLKENLSAGEGAMLLYKKRRKLLKNKKSPKSLETYAKVESMCLKPSDVLIVPNLGIPSPGSLPSTSSQSSDSDHCFSGDSDSELQTVLENRVTQDVDTFSETLLEKVDPEEVRNLPPWEQAKLPRSAFLAAQLDAIPHVNYSYKYGFQPLNRPQWVPPRCLASSFMVKPNMPCPFEIPSYLLEVSRPLKDLRYLAKPWWARDDTSLRTMQEDLWSMKKSGCCNRCAMSDTDSHCNSADHNTGSQMYSQSSPMSRERSIFSCSGSSASPYLRTV